MIVWRDRNGKLYWKKEIDDDYLLKICNCLTNGKYDYWFVTEIIIYELFEEAANRGLMSYEKAHELAEDAILVMEEIESTRLI